MQEGSEEVCQGKPINRNTEHDGCVQIHRLDPRRPPFSFFFFLMSHDVTSSARGVQIPISSVQIGHAFLRSTEVPFKRFGGPQPADCLSRIWKARVGRVAPEVTSRGGKNAAFGETRPMNLDTAKLGFSR